MATPQALTPTSYASLLEEYLVLPDENRRSGIAVLSSTFVQTGLGPAEIVALHTEAVNALAEKRSEQEQLQLFRAAPHFLIEVMLAYGDQYRAHLDLLLSQTAEAAKAVLLRERERRLVAQEHEQETDASIAMVAHELRSPLSAAKAMAQLSQRELARGHSERLSGYLERVTDAITTLSGLVDELVEVSRNEPPSLELGPVNLATAVATACSWVLPAANVKNIRVVCPDTEPIAVHGNADAIGSIVGNLLTNAVRYSAAGTRVTVRMGVSEDQGFVEVQDHGIGMSAEVRSQIFERFYRAPDAKRAEPRGLGVGLAIVKHLVEAHQGTISAESVLGQGSTFRVTLPVNGPVTGQSSPVS